MYTGFLFEWLQQHACPIYRSLLGAWNNFHILTDFFFLRKIFVNVSSSSAASCTSKNLNIVKKMERTGALSRARRPFCYSYVLVSYLFYFYATNSSSYLEFHVLFICNDMSINMHFSWEHNFINCSLTRSIDTLND